MYTPKGYRGFKSLLLRQSGNPRNCNGFGDFSVYYAVILFRIFSRSEVVAEACETMLTDTDATQRIGNTLQAKDATLFEKVKQWFRDLAAKLRRAYKGLNPDSQIAQYAKRPSSKWTAWCSCGRIWQWTRRRITGALWLKTRV